MPHDSKKRMSNTGTNILDFCRTQYGFDARAIPKTNSVRDDIEIVRRHLPSCKINIRIKRKRKNHYRSIYVSDIWKEYVIIFCIKYIFYDLICCTV